MAIMSVVSTPNSEPGNRWRLTSERFGSYYLAVDNQHTSTHTQSKKYSDHQPKMRRHTMQSLLEKAAIFFLFSLMLVIFLATFVALPAQLYADSQCLEAGYKKSYITVGFEVYCATSSETTPVKLQNK
jgi:hypothetical protein